MHRGGAALHAAVKMRQVEDFGREEHREYKKRLGIDVLSSDPNQRAIIMGRRGGGNMG